MGGEEVENILRKRGTEGEWWRRTEVDKVEGERKFRGRGKGIGRGEEGHLWEEGGRESLGGERGREKQHVTEKWKMCQNSEIFCHVLLDRLVKRSRELVQHSGRSILCTSYRHTTVEQRFAWLETEVWTGDRCVTSKNECLAFSGYP